MDFNLPILDNIPPVKKIDDIFSRVFLPTDHDLSKRQMSSQIDLDLGFNIKKIEEILKVKALQIDPETYFDEWGPLLHNGAQTWVGLDFQILQSSYHDLKILFDIIKPRPFQKIVDLGAGYGRIGIFLHQFYPLVHFLGIELVTERVKEANRIYETLHTLNKAMVVGDLSQLSDLPSGDVYFIYDFGSEEHIKKILELLKSTKNNILVVKGQICRNLMLRDEYFGEGFKVKKLEDLFIYYL
jgi:hypothetical protein